MTLGEFITAYRVEHRMSVREFARSCGLSHVQIIRMETGKNSNGKPFVPSIKSLKAVAKGMGIRFEDVLNYCQDIDIAYDDEDITFYEPNEIYIMSRLKDATPEQLAMIRSYVDFVMK